MFVLNTFFIIHKVMKYRKILIKYNVYLKSLYFTFENRLLYFTGEKRSCISRVKLDVLHFLR